MNHPPESTLTAPPHNILPFPHAHAADGKQKKEVMTLAHQVARILTLPASEALFRLVAEYAAIPGLSLSGEADAAREWIDDSRRNRQRKRMSLSFFRHWLKRERDALERRQRLLQQAMLASPIGEPSSRPAEVPPPRSRVPDLMHLVDEDRRTAQTKGRTR